MSILKIEEMTCQHCVQRISSCLKEQNLEFEIDLEDKTVTFSDENVDIISIMTALEEIGYNAYTLDDE